MVSSDPLQPVGAERLVKTIENHLAHRKSDTGIKIGAAGTRCIALTYLRQNINNLSLRTGKIG
jgi:hypothetical protein